MASPKRTTEHQSSFDPPSIYPQVQNFTSRPDLTPPAINIRTNDATWFVVSHLSLSLWVHARPSFVILTLTDLVCLLLTRDDNQYVFMPYRYTDGRSGNYIL